MKPENLSFSKVTVANCCQGVAAVWSCGALRNISRTPTLAALGTCGSSQLCLHYCIIESVLLCAMCVIVLEWVRKGYLTAGRFPGASFSAWKWEITRRCSGKTEVGGCNEREKGKRLRWETRVGDAAEKTGVRERDGSTGPVGGED